MSILQHFKDRYDQTQEEEYSLEEYLEICKKDPSAYATAAERLLLAIGEPEFIDTSRDPRLSRIFSNKVIKRYPEFAEFYGMEEAVENIVSFFRHAAQGLEEKKQILYLLGPVGGGKSSLAEKLKFLMQKVPFYAIKGSPVNESPLGLFDPLEDGQILEEEYGIPQRYLKPIMSPWAMKRLHEYGGDISQFRVVKKYPSVLDQIAVSKTEPGDDNNQDISALVGKVNIRMLEDFSQDDPDAYSFSGGLCKANQGLMEFVEMFKAPIKVLHPLLTATQEGNYNTTEGMGSVPFDGVILAQNSSIFSKMKVYDGQNIKDTDPKAKSIQEYRDAAGVNEGMDGLSTRFAFKILSKVFNFDTNEVAANPVHLLYVLEKQIEQEQFPAEIQERYLRFIKEFLAPHYVEFIGKEIQTAYLESYSEYGQNLFDRYVTYADLWIQDQEFRDPETGEILDRPAINDELEKIEKPAGISNPKDFRNEVVNFVLRARANNQGENPSWLSYEKLRSVIEKKMFSNTEDLLPVISFNPKASQEDQKKHKQFVDRMVDRGYTEKQVRLLAEWYLRVRKSH